MWGIVRCQAWFFCEGFWEAGYAYEQVGEDIHETPLEKIPSFISFRECPLDYRGEASVKTYVSISPGLTSGSYIMHMH
jgi:hypothetical protein